MSIYKVDPIGWVFFFLIEVCIGTEVLHSDSINAITGKSHRPVQEYVIGNGYRIYHILQDIINRLNHYIANRYMLQTSAL